MLMRRTAFSSQPKEGHAKHAPFRRTTPPKNKVFAIDYWDEDRKYRSGVVVKETSQFIKVKNILGEIIQVPIRNIVKRRMVDGFYGKNRTLQETLDYFGRKTIPKKV